MAATSALAGQYASEPDPRASESLNDRQRRFVAEFVADRNATAAAIRAGYSKKTAYSIGSRLLRNVEVRKLIDELETSAAERLSLDHEWVLSRLMREAEEAKRDSARVRALEILGRHLGMFVDRLDVTSTTHFETSIPPELTADQRENVISMARVFSGKEPRTEPTLEAAPSATPDDGPDEPDHDEPDHPEEDQPLSVFAAAVRR